MAENVKVCKACKRLEEARPDVYFPGSGAHRQHFCGRPEYGADWIDVPLDDAFVQRRLALLREEPFNFHGLQVIFNG